MDRYSIALGKPPPPPEPESAIETRLSCVGDRGSGKTIYLIQKARYLRQHNPSIVMGLAHPHGSQGDYYYKTVAVTDFNYIGSLDSMRGQRLGALFIDDIEKFGNLKGILEREFHFVPTIITAGSDAIPEWPIHFLEPRYTEPNLNGRSYPIGGTLGEYMRYNAPSSMSNAPLSWDDRRALMSSRERSAEDRMGFGRSLYQQEEIRRRTIDAAFSQEEMRQLRNLPLKGLVP